MYIRKISRKNADGSVVSYLQLAHNVRDPQKGYAKAEVIYNFGCQEELDLAAIKRLVKSLPRFLSPKDALEATAALVGSCQRGHKKEACALLSHKTYGFRYLRESGGGKIAIDMGKNRAEERLERKYLLSTSDDSLSPEDVALGYKQLLQVESAFRTLKTTLELRPIHHRKEDRSCSHVLLCWLALPSGTG
jgi:Transposase DDE domain